MDDETAVFAEPVAAACRIFEQMAVDERARVAVVGDGRMGLLVAQVMKTAVADVTVFGRHDRKLAIARSLGLTATRTDAAVPRRPVSTSSSTSPAGPRGCAARWSSSSPAARSS